jgi:hypothetical protein
MRSPIGGRRRTTPQTTGSRTSAPVPVLGPHPRGDRLRQVGDDRRDRCGDDHFRRDRGSGESVAIALFDSPGKADRRRAADSARDARAAFHFVADRIAERGQLSANDLARGEAGIVSVAGQKVAAFRGDDGALRAVSSRCTHLGCQVISGSSLKRSPRHAPRSPSMD